MHISRVAHGIGHLVHFLGNDVLLQFQVRICLLLNLLQHALKSRQLRVVHLEGGIVSAML